MQKSCWSDPAISFCMSSLRLGHRSLINFFALCNLLYACAINFLQSDPIQAFRPDNSSITLNLLSPCQSYWAVLSAYDCTTRVTSPPALIGQFEPVNPVFVVSVNSGADSTVVSWRGSDTQQQLRSVVVTVSSECPTGVMPLQRQVFTVTPDQGNSVNLMPFGIYSFVVVRLSGVTLLFLLLFCCCWWCSRHIVVQQLYSSAAVCCCCHIVTLLGLYLNAALCLLLDSNVLYHVQVSATLCDNSVGVYNETHFIPGGT